MSLSYCVLGSGSAGNSTLVTCSGRGEPSRFLIDCGLSPRATALRLKSLDVRVSQLDAIILTHLDTDHFHVGWLAAIRRHKLNLRFHIHHRHRNVAWRFGLSTKSVELFKESVAVNPDVDITGVILAHDDLGSVGFVIEHDSLRLGYATDLGRVPDHLHDHFINLHALALESNYDRSMQMASARPAFLKRRIMGGAGHLSNEQALDAIEQIDACSQLSHVALLHLSRQCNDPDLVRDLYSRRASHLCDKLTITCQHQASPVLNVSASPTTPKKRSCAQPRQLTLFSLPASFGQASAQFAASSSQLAP